MFSLDILFHRMSEMAMFRQQLIGPCRHCSSFGPANQTRNKRLVAGLWIVGHPSVRQTTR